MNRETIIRSVIMFLASGVILVSILCFSNSDDPRILKILNQIKLFSTRSNLQKVYLKSDKDKYITGETIWLKAYLLNAASLQPEATSNEIFIDLVGKNNSIVQSLILRNMDGFATGDIILDDSIPEGNYQLVAYTNWMKNFDESFFYSKTIEIVNPDYNKYITHASLAGIKSYNKEIESARKERTIQFFPESGNLIAGLQSHVAFKAVNNLGYGIDVNGELFDDNNKRICHLESKHLGMGDFKFTPETGKKYYAKITFADGSSKSFDLPFVNPKGYVMMVNFMAGDQIRLNIQSNIGSQMDEKNDEFIIVGQSRGEVKYISKGVNKGKPLNTIIPKKYFPAGIAQITLFNGLGEPVCERLIFIQPKENENRTVITVDKTETAGDLVYKINLKQTDGKPACGNVTLSLCETLKDANKLSWKENIVSNLLLTSDLKGKVENATEYFDESNSESIINLDYVMMVNGWRRFVWKEILAGQFQPLLFAPSEGINPNEISTTTLKPITFNLTNKAFLVSLNEQYDSKMLRKNSREAGKSNSVLAAESSANTVVLDHKTLNSYSDMIQYLKGRVAGVSVTDGGIIVRGVNSFIANTDPLILQDNMQIPFSTLKMISPNEVSSVEVLKGPDASIYGSRGSNGVLIIHMRTSSEDWKEINSKITEPAPERTISFYKAREFYVPAYDSWIHKPSDFKVPRSVFWKPNIVVDSTGVVVVRVKRRTDISNITTTIEGIAADGTVLCYQTEN